MRILLFLLLLIPTYTSLSASENNVTPRSPNERERVPLLAQQPTPQRGNLTTIAINNDDQQPHHDDRQSREQQACWIIKGFLGYICLTLAVGGCLRLIFNANHQLTL